jgi:hypothetical protein
MRRKDCAYPVIAAMVLAGALLGLLAPAAHANADDDYLWELNGMGITPATTGRSLAQEIAIGHAICIDLQTGADPSVMVANMQGDLPRLTRQDVQLLVTAASANYCQDYSSTHLFPWSPHPGQ